MRSHSPPNLGKWERIQGNPMSQKHQTHDDWIILPGTTIGGEVGTFRVDFTIRNRNTGQSRELNGLVDTGASFTIIPMEILDELGIERDETELFSLADGSVQELALGRAEMELQGRTRDVYVVFGTAPNKILLGAMALEAFALAADAKNHRLIRAELTI